jgi:hypothetical protein
MSGTRGQEQYHKAFMAILEEGLAKSIQERKGDAIRNYLKKIMHLSNKLNIGIPKIASDLIWKVFEDIDRGKPYGKIDTLSRQKPSTGRIRVAVALHYNRAPEEKKDETFNWMYDALLEKGVDRSTALKWRKEDVSIYDPLTDIDTRANFLIELKNYKSGRKS